MAKLVKKTKRKLKLSTVLFLVFGFGFLVTSLLVNCANNSLTIKIQDMQDEIAILRSENQNLNYQIQSLANKDRVYEIAAAADMNQVQDNIISILGE